MRASWRTGVAETLRSRSTELREALQTRVYAIADPAEAADPQYVEGLRTAIEAALEYGIVAIEAGERIPPVPTTLLAQARIAARNQVSLETVLRRYFAGYVLLGDFLLEAADIEGVEGAELKGLMRAEAAIFDRLIVAVSEEYDREEQSRAQGTALRRAERVRRLLDGELLETNELGYELDGHHLGLVSYGPGARAAVDALAGGLDCRLLAVRREEGIFWAWLGSRSRLEPEKLQGLAAQQLPADLTLAIGEPGEGVAGWRLTHRQARAALTVALRGGQQVVRYADVALLASALQSELLVTSLHEFYLAPLLAERDGGKIFRETLCAYFAAEQNVSSTAAALGINRGTVTKRLRAIEERIGRSLASCGVELSVALRLSELRERHL